MKTTTEPKTNEQELRELDAWIAEHVCDFAWVPRNPGQGSARWLAPKDEWEKYLPEYVERGIYHEDGVYPKRVPYYTTDPAAALAVLKKCAEKLGEESERAPAVEWLPVEQEWQIIETDVAGGVRARGKTAELAIARFAKRLFSE